MVKSEREGYKFAEPLIVGVGMVPALVVGSPGVRIAVV